MADGKIAEDIGINTRSNKNGRVIRSTKIKNVTNDKGCWSKKGARAQNVGTEPDESVKGCVRHFWSIL